MHKVVSGWRPFRCTHWTNMKEQAHSGWGMLPSYNTTAVSCMRWCTNCNWSFLRIDDLPWQPSTGPVCDPYAFGNDTCYILGSILGGGGFKGYAEAEAVMHLMVHHHQTFHQVFRKFWAPDMLSLVGLLGLPLPHHFAYKPCRSACRLCDTAGKTFPNSPPQNI